MPIYEYQCAACEHKLEKLQKLSDELLKDCPACNEPKLVKLVSAAAFRLKGAGWYETDFKTGNKKNVSSGDTKPETSSKSSDSSSSSGSSSDKGSSSNSSSSNSSSDKSLPSKSPSSGNSSASATS